MNKKVLIVVALLVGLIAITVVGTSLLRKDKPLILQGEVEVSEMKISSKLQGRVEGIVVKEGDKVTKGDFLFAITTPEIDAKLQQAQAAKRAAQAQSQKADAGTRKQILNSARSLMGQAEIAVGFAQKSFDRINNLYKEGVVPEQKYDEVKTQLNIAIERKKIATDQYNLAKEGAQIEDKESAEAMVQVAAGAVEEVESYLSDASQYAPFTGEVSKIIAKNGELSSSGYPIVTMIDIENAWVSFNIKETLLPKIKVGNIIEVYVPGLDKMVKVKIQSTSVQGEYATWVSTSARDGFDIKTFEVKAYPVSKSNDLRPGMTVLYTLSTNNNE